MALYVKGQQGDSHKGDWLNKNGFRIQFSTFSQVTHHLMKGTVKETVKKLIRAVD